MATSLVLGEPQTGSATQRRKNAYRQDLELQMKEKEAARLRERYQDMSVNASGWLDPEKRPDRLKPLGGAGFMTDRSERDSKVRPYHTLFLYDRIDPDGQPLPIIETRRRLPYYVESGDPHTLHIRPWQLNLDPVAPLVHQPVNEANEPTSRNHKFQSTEATTARPLNDSINQAYNFYATRDLDRPGGYGSIIQPLVVPYVDNRPIIMPDRYHNRPQSHPHPRYNPFQFKDNSGSEMRSLIALLERERNKNSLAKTQDDLARRLRKELDDERKRLGDRDADARRRAEDLRLEMEGRRREWERQRLLADRAKKDHADMPKTAPIVVRPSSAEVLTEMDDTRRRLIDERRKIEELLRAQKSAPNYNEVKVLKRPPPPPTPTDSDLANRRIVEDFNQLKFKDDKETRGNIQKMYPEHPRTNKRLEAQQRALLKEQEEALMMLAKGAITQSYERYRRPAWMDKPPTPFPHRLRRRDQLYANLDADIDHLLSRAERRERAIDKFQSGLDTDRSDDLDRLKLSHWRPLSTETLADDTWIRPASATAL
ncbi:hypothetical protein RRG08_059118 [Elysia crispata]|uniref:Centrosome and spindle pole-associated protein 1 C-terminal domain-containing protein n=1 Tax=Elysia crispata TaxID=231223 RepID=A0AAE0XYP5_9GAST|nr:hypothetical protein RRG08_059118 [Elysia crispata]